ncbi:MAG: linear amide C-N hydrolase, partial [Clostridia bacterium]|nr:linear amide C-N hydrolase [Clostridia bacterium]
ALCRYSLGMGAMGLPGDLSSSSRYVRAAFTKLNSVCGEGEAESVAQVFHILGSVTQQKGCTRLASGEYEFTRYSACINASRGLYYCKTYDGLGLTCVDLRREDLEGQTLTRYPLKPNQEVLFQKTD